MTRLNLLFSRFLLNTKLYAVSLFSHTSTLKKIIFIVFSMVLGGVLVSFSHLWVYPILGITSLFGDNGLFLSSWPVIIGGHLLMFVPIYIVGLILSCIFYRLEKAYTLDTEEINELKNLRSQKDIELETSILSQKTKYFPELKIKKLTHKI